MGETVIQKRDQETALSLDQRVAQLSPVQKEFLLNNAQVNFRTGVVEDFANSFNWIEQAHGFYSYASSLGEDTARELFEAMISGEHFFSYEKYLKERYTQKYKTRKQYQEVLGSDFPWVTDLPSQTCKDALNRSTSNFADFFKSVAPLKYDDKEHVENLCLLWKEVQQVIYGT